jgi:thioredoxin reductase (NADPH)
MNTIYDVIILGSGPAGYSAAIYTSRAFLKTLVLTGPTIGGQLTTTTEVDNYAGFEKGILGPQLLTNMKAQAERFGTEIVTDTINRLAIDDSRKNQNNNQFILTGETGTYEARSVIIATGASAKMLGIPTEETFRGKGISYCATCDGFFFRGKNIAVLGGGDTAMEEATFLTTFASHVTIIHRRDEFRASPIMLEKAKKNPKISFLTNTIVTEFTGDTSIKGLKLTDAKTGKNSEMPIDGVFVAIGHTPATSFLKEFIELDEKGYIVTYQRLAEDYLGGKREVHKNKIDLIRSGISLYATHTSVRGVFAAGDCVDAQYRQGIVAAGMGAMAALDAQKYLSEQS